MLVVLKFGGSSVSDAEHLKKVAQRIVSYTKNNHTVIVVVSAMGDATDELMDLSNQISLNPPEREMDILLTAGERISMSLLAMAVNELGVKAKSFTGQQAGIHTTESYGCAHISHINPTRILNTLDKGYVAIVAGFQGVHVETNDVTTLGRGGSDTTAVALAAALNADLCEIYTDVDGVFTTDPRIYPKAKKIAQVGYNEMLEMAASGAKVLALRCVEYARRYNVKLHVRSAFSDKNGTIISKETLMHNKDLEAPLITAVAHDASQSKITISSIPDRPGVAAEIFELLSHKGFNIDMIVQNVSVSIVGYTDLSFTLPETQSEDALEALNSQKDKIGFGDVTKDDHIGKISLIGSGMTTNSGVAAKFFAAMRDENVNVEMISTSEIRISIITRISQLSKAVASLHRTFDLDTLEDEAVVYGGTGR